MRTLATMLAMAFYVELTAAANVVDLNAPGALEALRVQSPKTYAKISAILATAEERPSSEIGEWIRAGFDASDVEAMPLWHVSDPPKLKLSFTLDRTRYTAVVVGRFRPVEPIPAK